MSNKRPNPDKPTLLGARHRAPSWWSRLTRAAIKNPIRTISRRPGSVPGALQATRYSVLLEEAVLRRLERLTLVAPTQRSRNVGGERRSTRRAPAAEFVEHRAYSPGDDLRRVDWNVLARLGTPVVRLGELPARATVRLVVDCSRSLDWGDPNKLRCAKQLAAGIGYVALCELDRVVVEPLGGGSSVPLQSLTGKPQAAELFRSLGALAPRVVGADRVSPLDVERELLELAPRCRAGDVVFLVSDLLVAGGFREAIPALQGRGADVRVLQVLSPQELRPNLTGELELVDVETGARRELTLEIGALERYGRRLASWLDDTAAYCVSRGVPYALVDTATPIERTLLSDLRQRGVVA